MLQRLIWYAIGLAALVGAAAWYRHSIDPINQGTFERIKEGMTLEEVQVIAGKPTVMSHYACEEFQVTLQSGRTISLPGPLQKCEWLGKAYRMTVWFCNEGKALRFSISDLLAPSFSSGCVLP